MFGLATSEDVRGVSRELDQRIRETDEAIKELAREVRFPTKGQTSPKLYTVTTWVADSEGNRHSVCEYGNAVEVKTLESLFSRGLRVIGEGGVILVEMIGSYSYSLTEQKPEGVEKPDEWQEAIARELDRLNGNLEKTMEGMVGGSARANDVIDKINKQIHQLRLEVEQMDMDRAKEVKRIIKELKPQPKGAKR